MPVCKRSPFVRLDDEEDAEDEDDNLELVEMLDVELTIDFDRSCV